MSPGKGLSKLTRQGVRFTEQEGKRINALQESGKFTEAQKVLLEAVEKQVGGTAEATATSSEKMRVAFGEVQEAMGGLLADHSNACRSGAKVAAVFFATQQS